MGYERSPSPAERGLQTSHKELSLLKKGHAIPLRTVPGSPQVSSIPREASNSPVGGYPQQGVYSPEHTTTGPDGLHWSQRGFQDRKDKHETDIRSRSPVYTAPRQGYGVGTPTRVQPPYAEIDGTNPYQFRDPLPPTRAGYGYPRRSASPSRVYFNAEPYRSRVNDPVYDHQGSPTPIIRPVELISSSPQRIPDSYSTEPRRSKARISEPPVPFGPINLGGNWVSMPDSAEVLHITHNVAANRLVGVATKDAPWSDIKTGTSVEGYLTPDTQEIELYQAGTLVLRLNPHLLPDDRIILRPSQGTQGQSGYWEVLPTETVSRPTPAYNPMPENYLVGSQYDEFGHGSVVDEGTTINIYT
eukprot:TRINITY_DN24874_c0_g3_i1.p1 TRINITY_DN24874_c0_g3~~TRINITY_DN24874_c0_g3_i1.p1  ORF type:complete len:365 (+),score=-2.25 TRINITY_DN24874_c0_g3_i1:24-1097(+)